MTLDKYFGQCVGVIRLRALILGISVVIKGTGRVILLVRILALSP